MAYDLEPRPDMEPKQTAALADAEQDEIQGNWSKAIDGYQRYKKSPDAAERALGMERPTRTYSKAGMRDDAVRMYRKALNANEQRIGAVPADLVARFELCALGAADWAGFYRDLVASRWRLNKSRYLFYSDQARDWVGASDPARQTEREKMDMAGAVEQFVQTGRPLDGSYISFGTDNTALIMRAAVLRARLEKSVALDRELRIRLVETIALDRHSPLYGQLPAGFNAFERARGTPLIC